MILGHIVGKINTNEFSFEIKKEISKFEYVQVYHDDYGFVLCQVIEIEKSEKSTLGRCIVMGFSDENGKVRRPGNPFNHGAEVLLAEDELIQKVITSDENLAYIGKLKGKDIRVSLDLNKILTKHLAVLAKSGSGKSYTVGVLIEEIAKQGIPMIIIDPHGEHASMRRKNDNKQENKAMPYFGIQPEAYDVMEYGDASLNPEAIPLRLPNNLSSHELIHLLPGKMNANQLGLLYNAVKDAKQISFTELLFELEKEENSAKWSLINMISYLQGLEIFSDSAPPYQELLHSGKITTINLRGYAPDIQEIIVYKLCQDLFDLRKKNSVPPFFLIIEEAHNYCPERNFGETKCSKIIRTIASEGRKFGLGLCVISQRPARVDKSVLSQCSTQIIQKVTNPNDLRAVSNSVEGLTNNVEKEIQNLPVGTALITGITEIPMFVNIRPRKSRHGGRSVNMIKPIEDFKEKAQEFEKQELLPLVLPKISKKDIALMSEEERDIKTILVPSVMVTCEEDSKQFKVMIDMTDATMITNVDEWDKISIPDLSGLSSTALVLLRKAYRIKRFGKEIADPNAAQKLLDRGLLTETYDQYLISHDHAFQKLSTYQVFNKVDYANTQYNQKMEKSIEVEDVKKRLSLFTKVIECVDCFAVKYDY
ncbi:MAG: ATP-binding protein [Nanoarchaeota archaeon]|nr:ATP-binding protein [Nanoarchaeota archaeon]